MHVKVAATGLFTYPDMAVVCREPEFEAETTDTLSNPTIVVEVLSASTENYDRGKKPSHYRRLPTLNEYVWVSQDEAHVEHYAQQVDGHWLLIETTGVDGQSHCQPLTPNFPWPRYTRG